MVRADDAADTDRAAAHLADDDRIVGHGSGRSERRSQPDDHARRRAVVYVGNNGRQLFVRPLDQLDPTAIITGAAPLNWVFVSPDGQWVGFDEGGTLRKVAFTGGLAVTILNTGLGTSSGATWTPDDTMIFATPDPSTGLQRVSAGGGEATVLTRPAPARGELDHVWPEMLPGGRALLYTIIATTGGPDAAQVALLDLTTGTLRVLMRGGSHAHYIPTGHPIAHPPPSPPLPPPPPPQPADGTGAAERLDTGCHLP